MVIFDTVAQYNDFNNYETLHPLVSVIDFSNADQRTGKKMHFGLYCIILKDVKCGDLSYGRNTYDYQKGTLVFVSPRQIVDVTNKTEPYQPMGHGLVFHPDMLLGTPLGKSMKSYHFFNYNTNEALHLSEKERDLVLDLFAKIQTELEMGVDKHSKKVIATNIELFLSHCARFYDRQFITRENANMGILEKFEDVLNDYFSESKGQVLELPSVNYCAHQVNLSSNYFGDLVKKETGKSAQQFIQSKIIEVAKQRLFDTNQSISEIGYQLGFKYPQHFNRLFKNKVGFTPKEYRNMN